MRSHWLAMQLKAVIGYALVSGASLASYGDTCGVSLSDYDFDAT